MAEELAAKNVVGSCASNSCDNGIGTALEDERGSLLLRTRTAPADTNPAGDIFGGWIMSQLDLAGAILARELARGRVVTVAVDAMSFLKPVGVGDVVCCYGRCIKIGRTSMKIHLQMWVKKIYEREEIRRELVTEADFTYVCVDAEGKPREVPQESHALVRPQKKYTIMPHV